MANRNQVVEKGLDRKQRKAIRNRKKLKESGLDVIAEKGLYETTIEDITETADLGKGTFYSHFDNKENLFNELLEDSADKLINIINKHCEQPGQQSLESVLEKLLDAHFTFFKEHYENFIIIFQGQGMLNLQKEDEREVLAPILKYIRAIENCLRPYTKDTLSASKLRKLACVVVGFVTGYFSFATIGLNEQEIISILSPLKRAYVEALLTFLSAV